MKFHRLFKASNSIETCLLSYLLTCLLASLYTNIPTVSQNMVAKGEDAMKLLFHRFILLLLLSSSEKQL